ncbi:MAG: hypothetical protein KY459_07125 [Acidobacteria bacterium]|nr:hypothetical protein [Acidobacteriota bacterium]
MSDAFAERRRAVRRPSPPTSIDYVLPGVNGQSDLAFTNHGVEDETVKACLVAENRSYSCRSLTISPAATVRTTANTLFFDHDGMVTLDASPSIEARADGTVAKRLEELLQNNEFGNLAGMSTSTITLATLEKPVTFEGVLRDEFGSPLKRQNITLNAYTHQTSTIQDLFETPIPDQLVSIELLPLGHNDLWAHLNTPEGRVEMQSEFMEGWIPNVNPQTTAILKNSTRKNETLVVQYTSFPENQDNQDVFIPHNQVIPPLQTHTFNLPFSKGSAFVQQFQPIHAYTITNGTIVPAMTPAQAANADWGLPGEGKVRHNISINDVNAGDTITLLNIINIPITGTVTTTNDEGTTIHTQAVNLPVYGNNSYTAPANGRITLELNDNDEPTDRVPTALLTATNTLGTKLPFRYEAPEKIVKVTGEEYVAKWLDPLKEQHFFISYDEMSAAINGSSINRSYVNDIVDAVWADPRVQNGFGTKENVKQWFFNRVDQNPANSEFCKSEKATQQAGFGLRTRDGINCGPVDFKPDAPNIEALFNTWREFYISDVEGDPTKYGGSPSAGPDLNTKPPWYVGQ